MRRATPLLVGADGVRPAGPQDACFYCRAKVGQPHNDGCVIRARTVVVRFEVELVLSEPESHDKDLIEFGYNEGSWCADNLANLLSATVARIDADGRCMCDFVKATVIREATAEDEDAQCLWVNELPG